MGRARSPLTSDQKFAERQEYYQQNKTRMLARAKVYYAENRPHMLFAMQKMRDEARRARLQAKFPRKDARVAAAKTYVRQQKNNQPCLDCDVCYPYPLMEYDHVRGSKLHDISTLTSRGASINMLQREIAKCDLVCANCHRYRTHSRQLSKNL